MKNIILDHFRRWWWVWVIGGLGWAGFNIILADPVPGAATQGANAFPVAVFLGGFLLSMDLQRGHARAVLALPVLPRQIARAWWLASVGIPALALAVISVVAWCVAWMIFSSPLAFPLVVNWGESLLLLGVSFFAVTGLPPAGSNVGGWKQQVRGSLFGLLFGGICGGWMFFRALDFHTPLGVWIFAVAVILSVLGWYRAEPLVMERAGRRASSPPLTARRDVSSRCAEGYGGLWFLAWTLFIRMAGFGLLMFVMFHLIMAVIWHSQQADSPSGGFDPQLPFIFSFQFVWMMSIQFIAFAMSIRHLRALPVRPANLAAVLVFVPLATSMLLISLFALGPALFFHGSLSGPSQLVRQGCLLQLAGSTIAVPLLIWRGIDLVNYLIGMGIMIGGILGTMFLSVKIPVGAHLVLAPLLVFGVYLLTKTLLERSSRVYRPRGSQFGGWTFGR